MCDIVFFRNFNFKEFIAYFDKLISIDVNTARHVLTSFVQNDVIANKDLFLMARHIFWTVRNWLRRKLVSSAIAWPEANMFYSLVFRRLPLLQNCAKIKLLRAVSP